MSVKGKLAKYIREIPIGALYRALVLPLIKVGGFWGQVIGWLSPRAVDKVETELDETLEGIEKAEDAKEKVDGAFETHDQRAAEEALGSSTPGAPSKLGLGSVQKRERKKRD